MTDARTDEPGDRESDGTRRTVDEPGGGPQRVVSEKSVDDILASLDDAPGEASSGGATDETGATASRAVETTTAADAPAVDDPAPDDLPADDPASDEATDDRTTADSTSDNRDGSATSSPGEDVDPDPTAADPAPDEIEATDDERPDGTELTYEDDDALAGRVAANDVTGADVRAAETDSDRESTPGIDEVDLSLDDLEDGRIGGTERGSDSDSSGDGSAADGAAGGEEAEDDATGDDAAAEASDDERSGFLRRLLPW